MYAGCCLEKGTEKVEASETQRCKGACEGLELKGGGGGQRVSRLVMWVTWPGHALSALDEVVLEALVSAHLPGRQALMVRQHLATHPSTQVIC